MKIGKLQVANKGESRVCNFFLLRDGESLEQVLRQEKKFLMHEVAMLKLCSRLNEVMIEDPFNGKNGYAIRSLYFDTVDEKDYTDKIDGLELRRKIRLRVYSPDSDFAKLEMKQKQGAYQKKRSLKISREDAEKMTRGDYSPLLAYPEPFAAECYGLMNMLCYRPKTIVEYRRRAYIAKENRIRITFDNCIKSTESCFELFSKNLNQYPVLDPFNAILEVKYNGFLLSYIKQLINEADRSEISVSKYVLAREAGLGY